MNTFKKPAAPPAAPPAAKALGLVRRHHGVPDNGMKSIPTFDDFEKNGSRPAWSKAARLDHMNAKRRQRDIADIEDSALPVILEIAGGKKFVVLKERVSESEWVVQFPDSREAPVSVERLSERYSGFCIFLSPVNENARGGFWRKMFRLAEG